MLTSLWQGDAWFYHQDCLPTSAVKNTLLLCFMFPMHLTLEIDWILTPSWHWSRQASYESNSLLVRQRDGERRHLLVNVQASFPSFSTPHHPAFTKTTVFQ